MRAVWIWCGRVAYWLTWPAHRLLLRFSRRTRVLIICDNQVLLVKGWLSAGQWQLPGGGLHRGEDVVAGAVREVVEETGIHILADQLWPLYEGVPHKRSFYIYAYAVELSAKPTLRRQAGELVDLAWRPIAQLAESELTPDSYQLLQAWLKR